MFTIYDGFSNELSLKERYRLIQQAGFAGVVLWWGEDFGRIDYRSAPKLARQAGLFIENIHTPFEGINNLWLDNLDGNALTEHLLECLIDCGDFKIPVMVMHLSGGENPPAFNKLGLNRIKRIVEKAEQCGIKVALENTRKTEYLRFVLDQIDSPYLGFCYDSGHHKCRTPNDDLLFLYGSRLMSLHLHDNDGTDDEHRLPFDGKIDWSETMRKIAKTGYQGAIALEVANLGYEDLKVEEFLQETFERAKRLENLRRQIL